MIIVLHKIPESSEHGTFHVCPLRRSTLSLWRTLQKHMGLNAANPLSSLGAIEIS